MSFHDTAWAIATMVSRRSYEEMRLIIDEAVPYPHIDYIGYPVREYVLHIPLPERLVPHDLRGNNVIMWRIFKACIAHEAGHAYLTDPHIYDGWKKDKDKVVANFSANLIEDFRVENFLTSKWAGLGEDLALANVIAYLRFRPLNEFDKGLKRIMIASLSYVFLKSVKGDLFKDEEETVRRILDVLNGVKWTKRSEALISAAEEVYNELIKYGSSDMIRASPVIPHHDGKASSEFLKSTVLNLNEDIKAILKEASLKLSLGDSADNLLNGDALSEANYVFHNEALLRKKEKNILSIYQKNKYNFLGVCIPRSDYSMYLRVKRRIANVTRNMLSNLILVKSEYEEETHQRGGLIDLIEAVQAVASESSRADVFKRLQRSAMGSAWAILVDASESLLHSRETLREVSICLAEVANGLMSHDSWGLYIFSDKFLVIKDFEETYNRRVQSRLGNLMIGGATYLPDALKITSERMISLPQNYKVIVVLTDGQPHGYEGIEDETKRAIKSIERSGITLIAIGIKSLKPKKYFRNFCYVNGFKDLAKNFVRLYYSITQWF